MDHPLGPKNCGRSGGSTVVPFLERCLRYVYASKDSQRKIKPGLFICLQLVCLLHLFFFFFFDKAVQLEALAGFIALYLWASHLTHAVAHVQPSLQKCRGEFQCNNHVTDSHPTQFESH